MITREEIRAIPELHRQIQRDKEQLRYLREKATSVPSGMSDRERVQTSPSNYSMKYVDAAVDLDKEIQIKETELLEVQGRARELINTLNDALAKRVMRFRYLKCYSWERVADMTGYTERRVQQIEWEVVKNL